VKQLQKLKKLIDCGKKRIKKKKKEDDDDDKFIGALDIFYQ
jgi:hypothetical protein